jgi:hypothetical protein
MLSSITSTGGSAPIGTLPPMIIAPTEMSNYE